MAGGVPEAQAAFDERRWGDARRLLQEAEVAAGQLDAANLELLASATYLTGDEAAAEARWAQAYDAHAAAGDGERSARCACWLGILMVLRGSVAQANGWFARSARQADQAGDRCPARGYLLLPEAWAATESGDTDLARSLGAEAHALGMEAGDPDLVALALMSIGEAEVAAGDVAAGIAHLDDAMVSVLSGEVSPVASGILYCAVIDTCMHTRDLRRASEWTDALERWCAGQPDLVPYRGNCMVHRSEILMARGEWEAAGVEADRARQQLSDPPHAALGDALYQRGEVHRLCGEHDAAEAHYREAHAHGRDATDGLALLWLATGKLDGALAAIRRALAEQRNPLRRPAMLAAAVEIHLAAGDTATAERLSAELDEMAEAAGAPALQASADLWRGAVLVASGQPSDALARLRRGVRRFREHGMPYEAARCQLYVAEACALLGDIEGAKLEREMGRQALTRLGAVAELTEQPDPGRSTDHVERRGDAGLTDRECEVLRLVARGLTNRDVAGALHISEHTVARHLQNIFTKAGLSSRAAATAYAYEHGLI